MTTVKYSISQQVKRLLNDDIKYPIAHWADYDSQTITRPSRLEKIEYFPQEELFTATPEEMAAAAARLKAERDAELEAELQELRAKQDAEIAKLRAELDALKQEGRAIAQRLLGR